MGTGMPGDRHNLPVPPTPLVGRAGDLETARRQVLSDEVRLLTLVGPAGIGKTRLVLALAADVLDAFPDGAWFVDLAPLSDPASVPPAITQVLGIGGDDRTAVDEARSGAQLLPLLTAYLRNRRLLLFLDNFEQILPAAACVADLLAVSPGLKVLATSRERLCLRAEHLFPVPPLSLPDLRRPPSLEALAEVPAVALFLQRARATRPDFALTLDHAAAVAEICVRLDGLPLAIELAAARSNLLAPAAMLAHLESRLPLLDWAARDMPARHQTLRGAIDWSYTQLADEEQALFRRLGVFVGGFELEAITSSEFRAQGAPPSSEDDETSELDLLASLVDKSLLYLSPQSSVLSPRYGMLETIREYALERLRASGEHESTQRRHAAYFLALAEEAEPELTGPQQAASMHRLEREHANLRAALSWAATHGEGEIELRLAGALTRFWRSRGYPQEGQRRLEGALLRHPTAPPSLRAKALDGCGFFAQLQGDHERATALLEEALALARSLGDERRIAEALNNLGALALHQGKLERARVLLDEALAICRRLGERWLTALTLYKLGKVAQLQSANERAAAVLQGSLALFRELGDKRSVAVTLSTLAAVAAAGSEQGAPHDARLLLAESLTLSRELRDRVAAVCAVQATVQATACREDPVSVARLLGAEDHLREMIGAARGQGEAASYDRAEATVRAVLDDRAYSAAWAEGRSLTLDRVLEEAIAVVQSTIPPSVAPTEPDPARRDGLSRREREVLGLLAQGLSNREIAPQLSIAERTVKFHITSILNKLGANTRGQAVAVAVQRGLL